MLWEHSYLPDTGLWAFSVSWRPGFPTAASGLTEKIYKEEKLVMKKGHNPATMTDLDGGLVEKSHEVANLEDMNFVTAGEPSVGREGDHLENKSLQLNITMDEAMLQICF